MKRLIVLMMVVLMVIPEIALADPWTSWAFSGYGGYGSYGYGGGYYDPDAQRISAVGNIATQIFSGIIADRNAQKAWEVVAREQQQRNSLYTQNQQISQVQVENQRLQEKIKTLEKEVKALKLELEKIKLERELRSERQRQ